MVKAAAAKREPHDTYVMRISRKTVDKLGIKLYDKASAVVAELIANAYDADAEHVTVSLPLDRWLATKRKGKVIDAGFQVVVGDDGHGMVPKETNADYLVVGKDRRAAGNQGDRSRRKGRKVMGHKGIGKLAPFGICKEIEVRSAGGRSKFGGHLVSHFVMDYDRINKETEEPYPPEVGSEDGLRTPGHGTKVTLRRFLLRRTPNRETFHRQLAARFGLRARDFEIRVNDVVSGDSFTVGDLEIDVMEGTRLDIKNGKVYADDGTNLDAPLETEDGTILRTNGWVALAKVAYKNPELAGVRIYARGKIVATTRDFDVPSGFTGEHTIRSYLVGELHADWLDEDEDLIRTDRQDILWASEQGQALQSWGVKVVHLLGDRASGPRRETARAMFLDRSQIESEIDRRFQDPEVRASAMKLAGAIGSTASVDELALPKYVEELRDIVLAVAPHKMLLEELERVSAKGGNTLAAMASLFGSARIAEIASLGQVAVERLKAIDKLNAKTKGGVVESEVQDILEQAPWLIEPTWTVLSANQPLTTFWEELRKWWGKQHKGEPFPVPVSTSGTKRPDFVPINVGYSLVVVEIKAPGHIFDVPDFERLRAYIEALNEFLEANKTFKAGMTVAPWIVLVADDVSLKGSPKMAYESLEGGGRLVRKTWSDFLNQTRQAHQDFLKARDRLGAAPVSAAPSSPGR